MHNNLSDNSDDKEELLQFFMDLRDAISLSVRKKYSLLFTGYSFGALLAEQAEIYAKYLFKRNNTKAITFDSPGSWSLFESSRFFSHFNSLKIVTYFSTPNFITTSDRHTGRIKFICQNEEAFKKSFENKIINEESKNEFFKNGIASLNSDGLDIILERFATEPSIVRQFKDFKDCKNKYVRSGSNFNTNIFEISKYITNFKIDNSKGEKYFELGLIETKEHEEEIFPEECFSIDFFLDKLQKINIDYKDLSNDLLTRQFQNLKDSYKVSCLN